jgi:hypothetical protein
MLRHWEIATARSTSAAAIWITIVASQKPSRADADNAAQTPTPALATTSAAVQA